MKTIFSLVSQYAQIPDKQNYTLGSWWNNETVARIVKCKIVRI